MLNYLCVIKILVCFVSSFARPQITQIYNISTQFVTSHPDF